jgi:uncharacterized protein (TIGR00251 family)
MKRLTLQVRPNARENRVEEITPDTFRVWVTATPEDGKANQAVVKLLAKHFRIAQSAIRIVRGVRSKIKIIEIKK